MAQPYVGEIRMFAGSFAPAGWQFCDGSPLAIAENDTLFAVIGTTYGGDGQSTFNLPDLQGRIPVHMGNGPGGNYPIGQMAGTEQETLTVQQIPVHTHPEFGSLDTATTTNPASSLPARLPVGGVQVAYGADDPVSPISNQSISPVGGSQPHTNFQPYLCVSFIISLYGLYPSQT